MSCSLGLTGAKRSWRSGEVVSSLHVMGRTAAIFRRFPDAGIASASRAVAGELLNVRKVTVTTSDGPGMGVDGSD